MPHKDLFFHFHFSYVSTKNEQRELTIKSKRKMGGERKIKCLLSRYREDLVSYVWVCGTGHKSMIEALHNFLMLKQGSSYV